MVFTEFLGQHFSLPDPMPLDGLDLPEDPRLDDETDLHLIDQDDLIDVVLAGLFKESKTDTDYRSLSQLLATLPNLSLSHCEVEMMPIADGGVRGLIPDASDETLQLSASLK